METEYRNCEVRLADDKKTPVGVLEGVLMSYGVRAGDRAEVFDQGSLHWERTGVVLREMHNRLSPIVRFIPEIKDTEVRIRIALPDSQRGRDAALGVKNGMYRGLSVEFRAEQELHENGVRRIKRAELLGAGLVDDPAYPACSVSIRHRAGGRQPCLETLWL